MDKAMKILQQIIGFFIKKNGLNIKLDDPPRSDIGKAKKKGRKIELETFQMQTSSIISAIKSWGCLHTSITNVMNHKTIKFANIDDVFKKALKREFITDKAYIPDWQKYPSLFGVNESGYNDIPTIEKGIDLVNKDNPFLVKTFTGATTTHFMMVSGYEYVDGEIVFIVDDPFNKRDNRLDGKTWAFYNNNNRVKNSRKCVKFYWYQ